MAVRVWYRDFRPGIWPSEFGTGILDLGFGRRGFGTGILDLGFGRQGLVQGF